MLDDEIIILLEDDEVNIDLGDKLNIIDITNAKHDKLQNLDYESSGHTGFARSRLNDLEEITDEEMDDSNIFVDANGVDKKIPINKLIDKTDVTVDDEEEMLIFGNKEE